MRLLIFLGVLAVIGLVVTGAIKLQRTDDNTITIQIDKTRVKQEARTVVDKGEAVLEGASSAVREAARQPEASQDPVSR